MKRTNMSLKAVKSQKVGDLVPAANDMLAIAALSTVLYVGGMQVFAGKLQGSELMAFLSYSSELCRRSPP